MTDDQTVEIVEKTEVVTTPVEKTEVTTTPTPVNVDDVQKKAYGHAMRQIDDTLAELGFTKPEGVKTSEYLKEILVNKGTKEDSKSVTPTTDDKDAIISQLKASLLEKEGKITELQTSTSRAKKEMFIDSLVSQANLNIPENLSEPERARMSSVLKNALKSELEREVEFKEVEGRFLAYQKDGQPILDEKADYLDPSKLLERNFSAFLAKPASTPKPAGTGGAVKVEARPQTIPSTIKTKSDFYSHLVIEKGMTMGSKDFNDAVAKAKEENPKMFS